MKDEVKTYLSQIGTKGGQTKSEAKASAARANGAKGGRPRAYYCTTDADGPKISEHATIVKVLATSWEEAKAAMLSKIADDETELQVGEFGDGWFWTPTNIAVGDLSIAPFGRAQILVSRCDFGGYWVCPKPTVWVTKP